MQAGSGSGSHLSDMTMSTYTKYSLCLNVHLGWPVLITPVLITPVLITPVFTQASMSSVIGRPDAAVGNLTSLVRLGKAW